MAAPTSARLAVLIDADNAQPSIVEGLLAEIAKYGTAYVKRIYGNWTSPQLQGWKDVLLEYSIHPVQQFSYTRGKNATDSAMIIDAMDLLYTDRFQGFCIVSSDSDFTSLARRIRESGLNVYGFGERKTPNPFVKACDRFIYTDVLVQQLDETAAKDEAEKSHPIQPPKKLSRQELKQDTKLLNLFRKAIAANEDEDGWANLGAIGSSVAKQTPEFDPRNYGYRKLSELVDATGLFEIDQRGDGPARTLYVRDKRRK
ncbi:NYN domain-containing protein [Dyella ginsengisoli]|uniref:NYN domain-containing protein n=1 Tax=Dyella ginsengisoli TaxID=363848 RepID=A0ABW8JR03_9GAMM